MKKDKKFSFICRSVEGCGFFQGRTTGKLYEFKIKQEGLSLSALLYFGHAYQTIDGDINFNNNKPTLNLHKQGKITC
jgi:hypothetical protein